MNQYLHYSLLLLVALFPILTASVQHGGSAIYLIITLVALVYAWPNWKLLSKFEKNILLGYCVFVFVSTLSMINADDWSSNITRLERLLRFLAIVPVYLLARSIKFDLLKALLIGSGIGCIVLAGQAWYSVTVKGIEVSHGAYHKILFGDTAMLLAVIVLVSLLTVAKQWWHYILGSVCIAAGLYASLLSGTRGSWLLLPLLLPVFIYLYWHLFNARRAAIVIMSLMTVVGLSEYWVPDSMAARIHQGVEEFRLYQNDQRYESSLGSRINMWRDSVTMFSQHPLFGVGLGDFKYERRLLVDAELAIQDVGYDHAHNIYFDSLATTGLFGLLALLLCVFILPFLLLYKAWQTWEHHGWDRFAILAGICSLAAFAIFGLSEGWLARNPFINTYAIFIAVLISSAGRYICELKSSSLEEKVL